jgi:pimeloyl-ACP methyl ester carboxylesterase
MGVGLLLAVTSLTGCSTIGRRLAIPNKAQGNPAAVLPESPAYEIVRLKLPDGTRIVGQFGKAGGGADPASAPTVVFFYGAEQTLSAPRDQIIFRGLRAMGANVFIPEFPGHGMSEGTATEAGLYATADVALDYVLSRPEVNPKRIIAAGMSRGTAVAIDLASRRPVAGLIAVGAFTSAADVLSNTATWMPRWLARSVASDCRFDSLSKIARVKCPVLFVCGGRDTTTPPWMTDQLAAATPATVTKHLIEHSPHNPLWSSPVFGLDGFVRDWIRNVAKETDGAVTAVSR